METLQSPQEEHIRKRQLAQELLAAARRGEIHAINTVDPRETSIETVQHIRSILKAQGILPSIHSSQLEVK